MRRGGAGGVLLVLALVSCSWSYTFLDLGVGSEVFQGSARCGGMGEVGLLCEETPFCAVVNPATLTRFSRPEVVASYRLFSLEEDWSFPTHDSFDAILGYTTYSRNANLYHSGSIAFTTGVIPDALGVAFGWVFQPAYDFRYDFHEEIRDRSTQSVPSDKVIADAYVAGDGEINTLAMGAGRSLGEGLSVGAGLEYLFGEYDIEARLTNVDTAKVHCWDEPGTETSDTFRTSNLGGVRYHVGLRYAVNKRVEIAGTMTSACDLDGDYSTSSMEGLLGFLPRRDGDGGEFTLEYPASYTMGVTYHPRNELLTVIEGDVTHTRWSDAENGAVESLVLEDTYTWHVGVEHVFYNERALRFGFVYAQSPVDTETGEAAVTIGSGFMLGGLGIEFSAKVGWREYRYFDLFDDSAFCAESREFSDIVEETSVSGLISITKRL
jgi:hypothetical protein